jgi:hypothetical protein
MDAGYETRAKELLNTVATHASETFGSAAIPAVATASISV